MPKFTVPPNYAPGDGYFTAGRLSPVRLGIKIHISADARSAQRLCNTVLRYLVTDGVLNKVRMTTEEMALARDGNQMCKFITIYPDGVHHLKKLLHRLDFLLCRSMKTGANAECHAISGDLPWGRSGYLYLRYGDFKKDSIGDDRKNVSPELLDFISVGKDPFEGDAHAPREDIGQLTEEQDNWPAYAPAS